MIHERPEKNGRRPLVMMPKMVCYRAAPGCMHTQRLRPDLPKELDHTVHVTANKSATRWVKHDTQVAEVKQHGESRRFTEELMLGALGATCRADDSRWRSPGSKTPACIITKVLFKDIRKNR